MPRVTNEELANLIGAVDDGVIGLKGKVNSLDGKVGELRDAVLAANGRQRQDHDVLLAVKGNQDNCPARKIAGNPKPDPATENRKILEAAKEHRAILAAVVGLAVTLGACLKAVLDMLQAFIP